MNENEFFLNWILLLLDDLTVDMEQLKSEIFVANLVQPVFLSLFSFTSDFARTKDLNNRINDETILFTPVC